MSILLSIIESPKGSTIIESTKKFGEQGGTIGRSADNYWVLSDPECFMSSCHCKITFESNVYILTDLSTNGTFLNGTSEPIGKGNIVQLQDGDEIELSDYKFKMNNLNVEESKKSSPFPILEEFTTSNYDERHDFDCDDPFTANYSDNGSSTIEPLLNVIPEETDPLIALGAGASNSNLFNSNNTDMYLSQSGTQSDQADILNQSIDWPNNSSEPAVNLSGSNVIPEDWDLPVESNSQNVLNSKPLDFQQPYSDRSHHEAEINSKIEQKNIYLMNQITQLKQQLHAVQEQRNNIQVSTIDRTVLIEMGLDNFRISDVDLIEINTIIGKMIREIISEMMQVLKTRSSIKNEFRMNVTTIQAVENNPLKFSENIDDAIENMFINKGNSYMNPLDAIRDGFQGIAEHQVAVLAGIRAAFKSTFDRFDPSFLEQQFEKAIKGKQRNAKKWEHFVKHYNELTQDMDNTFQYLFGDKFVQAYEEQLQRLSISHKSNL